MALTLPFTLGTDTFGIFNAEPADIRKITDLTESEISDSTLDSLIRFAGAQVNSEISVRIIEEKINHLDEYRQNKIDGSNTTYYVSKSYDWYLSDLNDDGDFGTEDIEVWQYDSGAATKTQLTPATISETGYFTLSTAPSNISLRVTYRYSPISNSHFLMKRAVTELTAALAYSKLEARDMKKISLGRLSLQKNPIGFKVFYNSYKQTISEIIAKQLLRRQIAPIGVPKIAILESKKETETSTGGSLD